jgi:hypothetical protein
MCSGHFKFLFIYLLDVTGPAVNKDLSSEQKPPQNHGTPTVEPLRTSDCYRR